MSKMKDVVAVNLETLRVRMIAMNKSEWTAHAMEMAASTRPGVGEEFFTVVDAGCYRDGDIWEAEVLISKREQ